MPFRVFYFEGNEAHIVARILINLPMFMTALIDTKNSLVVGQPPGYIYEKLYKIISMFDIEMPLNEPILSVENMSKYILRFWKFVDRNKWIWKEDRVKMVKQYV